MDTPTLIYCAAGNRALASIAIDAGYRYGAQLPNTIYFQPYFADQDWKSPDRERYMDSLRRHIPAVATVMDLEREEDLGRVLSWAEEAAEIVSESVIIIPKVSGIVQKLPRSINGRSVVLGYSVPTRYGGTQVPAWEFYGWPVHLLGGSPGQQMYLSKYLNIRSADGNMIQKLAVERCKFWEPGKRPYRNKWTPLNNGHRWPGDNAHHEAFRRSCENVMEAWRKCGH